MNHQLHIFFIYPHPKGRCRDNNLYFIVDEGKMWGQMLEILAEKAAQGVEVISCGTCLNFYQLSEKLAVGEVSNMYDIVEHLRKADVVVKP